MPPCPNACWAATHAAFEALHLVSLYLIYDLLSTIWDPVYKEISSTCDTVHFVGCDNMSGMNT